jgi:hypothetical protein
MRPVREITAEEEDFRLERNGPFRVIRRNPVEPEPIGTIVLCAFRIAGYDRDRDGSLMARMEAIDQDGETTGWAPDCIGLHPDTELVITQEEWRAMFGPSARED